MYFNSLLFLCQSLSQYFHFFNNALIIAGSTFAQIQTVAQKAEPNQDKRKAFLGFLPSKRFPAFACVRKSLSGNTLCRLLRFQVFPVSQVTIFRFYLPPMSWQQPPQCLQSPPQPADFPSLRSLRILLILRATTQTRISAMIHVPMVKTSFLIRMIRMI